MGKFIEILAMTLGGFSLFAVAFLGFAISSGKDLEEVPVIGSMLTAEKPEVDPEAGLTPAEKIPLSTRPKEEIIQHTAGVLQTFSVKSPYSQSELKELADSLKETKLKLERRVEEVEAESMDIGFRNEALDDREARIGELQKQLDLRTEELLLRESEVQRDEQLATEREQLVYQNKASSLADLTPDVAVERLASYQVEEVAKILHAMDDNKASLIVKVLPQDRWEEVVDRLSRLRADFPKEN